MRKVLLVLMCIIITSCSAQNKGYLLKNITIEKGNNLSNNIMDYLENNVNDIDDYILDLSNVNVNEVGEYEYTVTYKNDIKKGIIKVVPEKIVVLTKDIYLEVGDYFDFGDIIRYTNDESEDNLIKLNDNYFYDLMQIGDYKLSFTYSSSQINDLKIDIVLHVLEKGTLLSLKENDLEYSYLDVNENIADVNNKLFDNFSKAISLSDKKLIDSLEIYDAEEIDDYVKSNYNDKEYKSTNIIYVYNKYGYVIGYIYKVTITDWTNDEIIYLHKNDIKH